MEERLTSGDAYRVEESPSGGKIVENLVFLDNRKVRVFTNEFRVITKRARKITLGHEEYRGQLSGIFDITHFVPSAKNHHP